MKFILQHLYRLLFRPLLFLIDAETAHHLSLRLLCWSLRIPFSKIIFKHLFSTKKIQKSVTVAGIAFPNHVGLAAGFDKNAIYLHELALLGFGHIEIGTVTPKPQTGNPKPRLFRLKKDSAIINRMGFNNDGVDQITKRLKSRPKDIILGGNIGKNKTTPNENAVTDYLHCLHAMYEYVDYFAINVSSPNTPNLRSLQDKKPLTDLLLALKKAMDEKLVSKPIFLKIAPDLNLAQLDEIANIVAETKIDGIIATNTTISRQHLLTNQQKIERMGLGGLSGKPLTNKSDEVLQYLAQKNNKKIALIGVGGIMKPEDALRKLALGADIIQIYSGFIYYGPFLPQKIIRLIFKKKSD